MNRNILSLILAGGMVFTACAPKEKPAGGTAAASASDTAAAIPVRVTPVVKTRIARTIDYTGTIQAYEEVNMAPSTAGRVDNIYVEVGDRVQKGQKLFLMDRSQYYASKIQLANLEKDLARMDTLMKVGSIKAQTYDQTKAQYEVTKTNVDFMEANTLLEAPFNGIITGKYLEDGELYSGAPGMSGKAAVVTLMQINPVKITVSISEQNYPLIKKGMQARITADVYPDREFEGRIFRIHPTINPLSRTFNAEISIPNGNELLRPGMFARVYIDMGEVEAFVVPSSSVLVQEGTNERFIFVADGNIASRRVVKLGKRFDDKVEIAEGELKIGDSLVIDGQARLTDGLSIEIAQ
ncbi:MAG TPA: efflux RND transporter periplasmic adaptor subunit [Bacteroidales bacterium]|nr:efflux RND transporter periplasmic adaptor subunit [Bacteroidales bacterium]